MNLGLEVGSNKHGHTNYLQTMGTDISFKPMGWDFHAAFYYQMGKSAAGENVSAWMGSAKVLKHLTPMLSAYVGYDYLSGDDKGTDKTQFDALFGTHHKFYGAMDYFPGTLNYGLNDAQAGVVVKLSQKLSAQLDYHYFFTAQDVMSIMANSGYDRALGHEADLQFTYKAMKDVTLAGGCSAMLATNTLDWVKRTIDTRRNDYHRDFQSWAWVQLNINPRLLITKW